MVSSVCIDLYPRKLRIFTVDTVIVCSISSCFVLTNTNSHLVYKYLKIKSPTKFCPKRQMGKESINTAHRKLKTSVKERGMIRPSIWPLDYLMYNSSKTKRKPTNDDSIIVNHHRSTALLLLGCEDQCSR